jgi:signal transduction histidine kinase
MAQVATGALHSIGNVMNSINIAVGVQRDVLDRSRVDLLEKVATMLATECPDEAAFAAFAASDPRGRRLPQTIATLAEQLTLERTRAREEIDGLQRHLAHVLAVLASQQGLARPANERIQIELPDLLHEAVRSAALGSAGIRVEHEHGVVPALVLDPHRLLQIIINLLVNAKDALLRVPAAERGVVRIRTRVEGTAAIVEVSDDGIGISGAILPRIFEHGFTTKPDGHGFGLHASALAATELGGSLVGSSDGPGRGSTFTLTLPLERSDHD